MLFALEVNPQTHTHKDTPYVKKKNIRAHKSQQTKRYQKDRQIDM